ncbi:MAG: amylo-alpha-1,6-glucosidase [Candidatus Altiarchaeota archaeon]|nr:amylo-alpha-1,6-glucosidase [Candidatus Altiarchaeota archaeon]
MYADVSGGISPVFDLQRLGLGRCRSIEFLISNGLGGYCSTSICGLNTRKYHGLLVASRHGLDRRVVLEAFLEELDVGGEVNSLSVMQYAGALDDRGFKNMLSFKCGVNYAQTTCSFNDVNVARNLYIVEGKNAVVLNYTVQNMSGYDSALTVRPLVNMRSFHEVNPSGRYLTQAKVEGGFTTSSSNECMFFKCPVDCVFLDGLWYKSVKYALEEERGEQDVEEMYSPGRLVFQTPSNSTKTWNIEIGYGESEDGARPTLSTVSKMKQIELDGNPRFSLEKTGISFLVDVEGEKSIIAGYHWFADWGRDSMISLPGLTLINGKYDVAESILARFIDHTKDGRIPTRFTTDGPVYYDFDGSLWLIDRLKEHLKYAGLERSKNLLTPRWNKIKSIMDGYSQHVVDGILRHKSGTWMDTLERHDAVEVQALWYNALKVVEGFSKLLGDSLDYSNLLSDFESAFMDKYFNGSYLDDCLGDKSIRPNQAIAVSMDYSPIPPKDAANILKVVADELLTPCGLRTLSPRDQKYMGRYVGGVKEREIAYHNGTVWPWLLGPYCKAASKIGGNIGRKFTEKILGDAFKYVGINCIGSLNEIYDGNPPHTPRGAITQAWSVAEILRAYNEDTVAQKKL